MHILSTVKIASVVAVSLFCDLKAYADDSSNKGYLQRVVNEAVLPVMDEHNVPGTAVALTIRGDRHFFNYGVASKDSGQKITENTILEIGSISKTFTATLATYAQASGTLSLSDNASQHLPALAGSSFDKISLLNLATYTAGGLPLQFPDSVTNHQKMISWYKNWNPTHSPDTHRLYSNPSIGLFGYITAKSLGEPFNDLMEKKLFPIFGLKSTYITVPQNRMDDYAFGYSKDDKPVRVTPGILDSQAYGVKTTAADMLQYVEANMNSAKLDETLRRAIAGTQTGYYKIGEMTQGLGWEMYAWPTNLDTLLAGNSTQIVLEANKATKVNPPLPPQPDRLVNKTGSTNGFGAYVAFVPAKDIGIVMLANRNYPIPARVTAAHHILKELDKLVLKP